MKVNKTPLPLPSRSQPEDMESRLDNPKPRPCQLLKTLGQQSEGASNPAQRDQKQQPEGEMLELSLGQHFHHHCPQSARIAKESVSAQGVCAYPRTWSFCDSGVSAGGRRCCKPREQQHEAGKHETAGKLVYN